MSFRIIRLFTLAVCLVIGMGFAYTQEPTPITPDEIANAIVISDLDLRNLPSAPMIPISPNTGTMNRQVYRLAKCASEESPCVVVIWAKNLGHYNEDDSPRANQPSAAAWKSEQSCGITITNIFGNVVWARLEQRNMIKYFKASGGIARLPAKPLYGSLSGTYAFYHSWTQLNGPNAWPNWLTKVNSGSITITAEGILQYYHYLPPGIPSGTITYASRMIVNSAGTYCTRG